MFLLLLLSLSFEAVAVESSVPTACTHVLEFIEVLVPAKNRELLIGRWRVFLGTKLIKFALILDNFLFFLKLSPFFTRWPKPIVGFPNISIYTESEYPSWLLMLFVNLFLLNKFFYVE